MFSIKKIIPKYFVPNPDTQLWGKEIDFVKGKSYRIVAQSGSGKSSLIQFLGGLNQKYEGDIMLEGIPLKSTSNNAKSEFRAKKLSIVFQDLRLIPRLSVLENITLKSSLGNFPKERVLDFISEFGLQELQNKPVGEISQGEKQRTAIIRSLCQDFDFILLDEPFSPPGLKMESKNLGCT